MSARALCEETLAAYRQLGHGEGSPEELLLKHGEEFEPGSTEDRGEPKMCFKNAAERCIGRGDLTYCEGFVVTRGLPIPIHHAWCVDENGEVVETTLEDGVADSYFGVRVETGDLVDLLLATRRYGVLYAREFRELVAP